MTEQQPLNKCPTACVVVPVWLCWAAFGLLHGGHWLVIFFAVAQTSGERRRAMLHFIGYIVGILLTLLGGGYVRLDGKHRSCGNETGDMGRNCLWDVQQADYVVIYIAHYIGLAFCFVSWVYDAAQLPGWLGQSQREQPLRVCYSAWPFTSAAYPLLLASAVLWVTLSWCAFVDWKTNDNGLTGLAAVLLLVIALVGFAGCGLMHYRKPRLDQQAGTTVKPGPSP